MKSTHSFDSCTPRALSLPVVLALMALTVLTLAAVPARADVYIPTTTNDSTGACAAECSLRSAILAANANPGADVIVLSPGLYQLFLAGADEQLGATGDLDITDDLSIVAPGVGTIIDGGQLDRVFEVQSGVSLEILGITIRNGKANEGGAILNFGRLSLTRSGSPLPELQLA